MELTPEELAKLIDKAIERDRLTREPAHSWDWVEFPKPLPQLPSTSCICGQAYWSTIPRVCPVHGYLGPNTIMC